MQSKSEKTSSMMGLVVSVLLHGIFFAGCLALDLGQSSTSYTEEPTEIPATRDQAVAGKVKS